MGYKQVDRNVQLETGENAPKHEKVTVALTEEQKAEGPPKDSCNPIHSQIQPNLTLGV
jgi:hypothetical protein